MHKKTIIYITGPAGSGKTVLANHIQQGRYDATIIEWEDRDKTTKTPLIDIARDLLWKYNTVIICSQGRCNYFAKKVKEKAQSNGGLFFDIKLK